jgi:hypothetical protein
MRLLLAVILTTFLTTTGSPQGQAVGFSERIASPTVVATYGTHDGGDGTSILDLLVLWRGSPGWFTQGNGNSGGGGAHGGFGYWYSYRWATYGNITLMVEYDSARNTAKIRGREISLRDTNVVLMDGVDTANPTLVGTRWIDPQRFGTGDPVSNAMLIKGSPELLDFLRCDLTLPDGAMQTMMASLFAQACS